MNTAYRQTQILRLVRSRRIHTQDELVRELGDLGIQATQVTLSRDIRKLGLVKTADGYAPPAEIPAPKRPDLATVVAGLLLEVRTAQNIVVLKTPAGKANALAVELDRENWREEVGSVAGDDTILIVTPDNASASRLKRKLMELLQ